MFMVDFLASPGRSALLGNSFPLQGCFGSYLGEGMLVNLFQVLARLMCGGMAVPK